MKGIIARPSGASSGLCLRVLGFRAKGSVTRVQAFKLTPQVIVSSRCNGSRQPVSEEHVAP